MPIIEPQAISTTDISFEWPRVSDLIQFKVGTLVRLSGIRYIANRVHVKAIVARLSNDTEGDLVQSPSNHPSQLESFK